MWITVQQNIFIKKKGQLRGEGKELKYKIGHLHVKR